MEMPYSICQFVKNDDGQYESRVIWSGTSFIKFIFNAIKVKMDRSQYQYAYVKIWIGKDDVIRGI